MYCHYRILMATKPTPLAVRFWRMVRKTDGCWLWAGATFFHGYGAISGGRKVGPLRAHRVSWEIHFGPIPSGLRVLHHCDTPACVRPDHLFLGTQQDNLSDMAAKHRGRRSGLPGTTNAQAKLTDEAVREARAARANGATFDSLAHRYGVSQKAIMNAVNRVTWRHV
jgi:hypothetical protein